MYTTRGVHSLVKGMCGKQIGQAVKLQVLYSFQVNIYFVIFDSFLCFKLSQKPRYRFAYQWLDNVAINKHAAFDPNIPCG